MLPMCRRIFLVVAISSVLAAPAAQSQALLIYHVPLRGQIELNASRLVARTIEAAEQQGGVAIVLDVASSGGQIDAAELIARDLDATVVPTYAFVNPQAWGVAALVVLAADSVFMLPESSLGAGSLSPNPITRMPDAARSVMVRALQSQVARRGLDPRLGEAMVNDKIAIKGVVESGSLLTLAADAALQLGVADAKVDSLHALFERVAPEEAELVTVGTEWISATVSVVNHNWRDVRVYIVRAGSRFRLGTVTSMNEEVFTVPEAFLGYGAGMRILAEVIGSSEQVTTDQITLERGLVIEWVIENVLSLSNYIYFVRF